jgi:MFS family permease
MARFEFGRRGAIGNSMQNIVHLLNKRRFLPLFITQALGAFNDNLFKTAMVFLVVFKVLADPKQEEVFSAIATGISILPFLMLSALAGQFADAHDKAKLIRIVKTAEIGIMLIGALGIYLINLPLMMIALFALGIHSSFFGPIKYSILPQHLAPDEVLGGTGLVEAGTYIAILAGTILAGFINAQQAAIGIVIVAILGWFAGREVPPAPPYGVPEPIDYNIVRASWRLISATMHIRHLFLAIVSISFFWTIGAVLFVQFPPLVKNILHAEKNVASLFLAIFSIGIAIGSVIINRLLKNEVSARYAPASVIGMGVFIVAFHFVAKNWTDMGVRMHTLGEFIYHPNALALIGCLLGIAVLGGMFVVPLYAFLTTTVARSETARTVGANNIVNGGAMVIGSGLALALSASGVSAVDQFLMTAAMCVVSAWLAWLLHKASCDAPPVANPPPV